MTIEWKDIDFTDGRYSCSSEGEIRSNKHGRLLSGTLTPDGYRAVGMIMPNGKNKSFLWHRVVATVWHPNPDNYGQVDHLDKDRLNNHPSNLEWVTPQENLTRRGGMSFEEVLIFISPEGEEVEVKASYSLAKEYELNQDGVRALVTGKQKIHKGWTFKGVA